MLVLTVLFWILLFMVYYISLEYVLFKGRQYNRIFATLLNTFVPVFGSIPAYIMACKYEKRIRKTNSKNTNNILKCILISMQLVSVLLLFLPIYLSESGSLSGISLIFGDNYGNAVFKPVIYLVYLVVLPLVSAVLNFVLRKSNISNFFTYLTSIVNALTIQLLGIILSERGAEMTIFAWIYCILNIAIMFVSVLSLIAHRDRFLFKIEYKEKIDYVKEQQRKKDQVFGNEPDDNTYKCAKCGNLVKKGSICICIAKKESKAADKEPEKEVPLSGSYCVYCKRPLTDGEKCDCQGDGFGIVIKPDNSKNKKCMYCGQVLVGESTCVCEKIMKNSIPVKEINKDGNEPKKYFESQVEKGNSFITDELAELEKKINSRFEMVKESMEAGRK